VRYVVGFLVVVAGLFALVTLGKRTGSDTAGSTSASTVSQDERDRVQRFWATYRRATQRRIAGDVQAAADAYIDALRLNPTHHDALYYLGNMEFELGNSAAAEEAWLTLVQLDPTSARAHSQLGTLHFCIGDDQPLQPDRATAEFERAAAINREETGPLLSLGEIALVSGKLDSAGAYFDAVIGSNFTSVHAHFYQGYLAWASGSANEAAELLRAAAHHARPAAPSADTPGEGDTRGGLQPMVRETARCGALRAPADALGAPDVDADPDASAVYGAFDTLLRDVRTRLP
jgi:tetratricopeptide (TPR) repeat protein